MTAGSWPEFLGVLGSTVLLYAIYRICRPAAGRHVLRARTLRTDLAALNAAYRQSLRQRDPAPLLACRDLMLRARSASGDAHPDGTAPCPRSGAVPLNAEQAERWWSE